MKVKLGYLKIPDIHPWAGNRYQPNPSELKWARCMECSDWEFVITQYRPIKASPKIPGVVYLTRIVERDLCAWCWIKEGWGKK